MYELIQVYLGEVNIIDWSLTYADCLFLRDWNTAVSDGMARYACEARV